MTVDFPNLDDGASPPVVILIPVYDDWEAVALLLRNLDQVLVGQPWRARVLLIDDGSTQPAPDELAHLPLAALEDVSVLALRRNLGHQRAIAVGLAYVEKHLPCRALVVMDGDGEDAPADVLRLLQRLAETKERRIVFAERTRRSESLMFKLGYRAYGILHVLLTGVRVRVGNFSVVPAALLRRLVVVSELWNHYAAAVYKSKLPRDAIPTRRARRLMGRSRMNFVSLVVHGFSALSVFSDVAGVRLLIVTAALMLGMVGLFVALPHIPVVNSVLDPAAAVALGCAMLILLLQLSALALSFIFITLQSRAGSGFIPTRDHEYFVDGVASLARRPAAAGGSGDGPCSTNIKATS
jgi:hypothetical protein